MKYIYVSLGLLCVTAQLGAATKGQYKVTNATGDRFNVAVEFDVAKKLFEGHGPVLLPGQKAHEGEFERVMHSTIAEGLVLAPGEEKTIEFVMADDSGTTKKPTKIVVMKESAHAGMPIGLQRLEKDITGYAAEIIEEDGEIAINQLRHATGFKPAAPEPVVWD